MSRRICEKLNALDREAFQELVTEGDGLKTWRFVEKEILAL